MILHKDFMLVKYYFLVNLRAKGEAAWLSRKLIFTVFVLASLLFSQRLCFSFFFFAWMRLTQLFVAAALSHTGRGRRQQAFCQGAVIYLYNIFIFTAHPLHTDVALLLAGFEKHTCGQKPPSFEGQHAPSAHCQSRFSLYLGLVHTCVGIFNFYLTFLG